MADNILQSVAEMERTRLQSRGYAPLPPFFLLKEGTLWDERKKQPLTLTKNILEKIAQIQNERIATSGDFTPIVIGHTNRSKSEEEQPKPCGWASRFEVAQFAKDKDGREIYGLRAVPWSRPEKQPLFADHPRRSVEMWTDPYLIDPISLLGATTPRLDLGLHQLQRAPNEPAYSYDPVECDYYKPPQKLRLEMEEDPMPAPTATPPDMTNAPATGSNDILSQLFNSAEWKKLTDDVARCMQVTSVLEPMIQQMGADDGQGASSSPAGMGAGAGGSGGGAPPDPQGAGMLPGGGGPPAQMSGYGGGAPAGGSATMMPQQMSRAPMQFSHAAADVGVDYRDQQIMELQRQVMAMHLAREGDAVNAILSNLESQIVIDRQRDYETLVNLDRNQREAEVQRMLQLRRPVDPPVPPEGVPIQMQAIAGARAGGPITLQQARQSLGVPGDPSMVTPTGAPKKSKHEIMMEAVRNRKSGQSVQEAYDLLMGSAGGTTSVRS